MNLYRKIISCLIFCTVGNSDRKKRSRNIRKNIIIQESEDDSQDSQIDLLVGLSDPEITSSVDSSDHIPVNNSEIFGKTYTNNTTLVKHDKKPTLTPLIVTQ